MPSKGHVFFNDVGELERWLRNQGIDLSAWGRGASKSTDDLWREVAAQDCRLIPGPKRLVEMAVVVVEDVGRILCEVKQELRDGRARSRNQPPGEKIKSGETAREAVVRCVIQELGILHNGFRVVKVLKPPVSVVKNSASYPGLETAYRQHYAMVVAPVLPRVDFCTEEQGDPHDPVARHWWSWKERKDLVLPPFV